MEEHELNRLRDSLATYALLGLVQSGFWEFNKLESEYAEKAYKIANAMIEARETTRKP